MENWQVYLPADRYLALERGATLPARTHGAALFADISGFTGLTEVLADALGTRLGVEELTRQLNRVYDTLIAQVDLHGGSVIGFSGDAITCWFEDLAPASAPWMEGSKRALACALAMQQAMRSFAVVHLPGGEAACLAVKAAIASGPTRRFLVGDPSIQLLDVLAGQLLERMATGEQLAARGEVVADIHSIDELGEQVRVREWRHDVRSGNRFGVVEALDTPLAPLPSRPVPSAAVPVSSLRPWLLPAVYERLRAGLGEFLTELRPVVALFLRFSGIDYDGDDEAGEKLSRYICWVQRILARYEGTLLDITIGDKGSYLYAAWGAPLAHEDDPQRAALAALELRTAPADLAFLGPPRVGLSRGTMRVGTCGGRTRRTYAALGDEVNVAARLMQHAAPGEILVSERIRRALVPAMSCEALPAILFKGRSLPIPVARLLGMNWPTVGCLGLPAYPFPMIGREAEVELIQGKIELARQGQGQVVSISGEAGTGKSRLVAEVVARANAQGIAAYGGECQSYGTHTPYLVWRDIWRGFFGLQMGMPADEQARALSEALARIDPRLAPRAPLLGPVLNLPLVDNELTRSFDAKLHKDSLESLLVDCLKAWAGERPLLIVLEDMHWLDALSRDLLETLGCAVANLPVLIILAYRLSEGEPGPVPRLAEQPYWTAIHLSEFTRAEAERLAWAKLGHLKVRGGPATAMLVEQVLARAQGNPFYIEELLNYLLDRGLDLADPVVLRELQWPENLHSLILSRIDQLPERQKVTLKVASVIGRLFRVAWLHGYYPALGDLELVKADLDALRKADLTPLATPEPDLAYLFKHVITQEVAYESLAYATRAALHEQLAGYLEAAYPGAPLLDLLAYHYEQSGNQVKKKHYLRLAGEAAQAVYANIAALNYYARLLPLVAVPEERIDLDLEMGRLLDREARWDEAEGHYRQALAIAEQHGGAPARARCRHALGVLARQRGDYGPAIEWLNLAWADWEGTDDLSGKSQTLAEIGTVAWRRGEFAQASVYLQQGLALARQAGDNKAVALALNSLGTVSLYQGAFDQAWRFYSESLTLRREVGDKQAISISLNSLSVVAGEQGRLAEARAFLDEAMALAREVGDRPTIGLLLNNLGWHAQAEGNQAQALANFEEFLQLCRETGDKRAQSIALNNIGLAQLRQGRLSTAYDAFYEGMLLSHKIENKGAVSSALCNMGLVAFRQGDYQEARRLFQESLVLHRDIKEMRGPVYSLVGLAAAAVQLATGEKSREAVMDAVRFSSFAETLWTADSVEGLYLQLYQETVAAAQALLSPADFAAAWAAGREMTREEAMGYEGD